MKKRVDLELNKIKNMQLTHDITGSQKLNMDMGSQIQCVDVVGKIEHGMRRFGLTAGQFSFSNLIEHILTSIGKADVYISTWTASSSGIEKAFDFLNSGMIRNLKFMIDTGAKQYRDKLFSDLLDRFGDCIRTTRIHAKFAVLRNEYWNIVLRTSANLNRNTRLENFEIDENKEFADFFQRFFDVAFEKIALDENHQLKSSQKLKTILDVAGDKSDNGIDNDIDAIFGGLMNG